MQCRGVNQSPKFLELRKSASQIRTSVNQSIFSWTIFRQTTNYGKDHAFFDLRSNYAYTLGVDIDVEHISVNDIAIFASLSTSLAVRERLACSENFINAGWAKKNVPNLRLTFMVNSKS